MITREYKTVFIIGIGDKLKSGIVHDKRSPDYDDWTLDGEYGGDHDTVVVENLNKAMEIMIKERHVSELSVNGLREE